MARIWLKDMRKEMKISSYDAAAVIGMSQSHYSSIENGSRRPSPEIAKRIASFYGFAWTKFFTDTKEDK